MAVPDQANLETCGGGAIKDLKSLETQMHYESPLDISDKLGEKQKMEQDWHSTLIVRMSLSVAAISNHSW